MNLTYSHLITLLNQRVRNAPTSPEHPSYEKSYQDIRILTNKLNDRNERFQEQTDQKTFPHAHLCHNLIRATLATLIERTTLLLKEKETINALEKIKGREAERAGIKDHLATITSHYKEDTERALTQLIHRIESIKEQTLLTTPISEEEFLR